MFRANEIVTREVEGVRYGFRTPTLYDPAKARRVLTRQGIRLPSTLELQVTAKAGILKVGEASGDTAEGLRQAQVLEDFYAAVIPVDENDIDEPDPVLRGEEYAQRETERQALVTELYPQAMAIEATLRRHYPPYAELVADRDYYDDISRIEMVRLLLVSRDGVDLPRDDEGLLTQAAFESLPKGHRMPLASVAFGLIAPGETQRKN